MRSGVLQIVSRLTFSLGAGDLFHVIRPGQDIEGRISFGRDDDAVAADVRALTKAMDLE